MEKGKNLVQDLLPEERAAALEGMARKTETQRVRRHYQDNELQAMKEGLSKEFIGLTDKQEEFSAIKKEFNKAIKELNGSLKQTAQDIKRGFTDNDETVYLIDNQESGEMLIYDQLGNYLSSRPLLPSERQTNILQMPATGTHG